MMSKNRRLCRDRRKPDPMATLALSALMYHTVALMSEIANQPACALQAGRMRIHACCFHRTDRPAGGNQGRRAAPTDARPRAGARCAFMPSP